MHLLLISFVKLTLYYEICIPPGGDHAHAHIEGVSDPLQHLLDLV